MKKNVYTPYCRDRKFSRNTMEKFNMSYSYKNILILSQLDYKMHIAEVLGTTFICCNLILWILHFRCNYN